MPKDEKQNQIHHEEDSLITETGTSYRDRVTNIDTKGKRVWIFPSKPSGAFHKARLAVGYFLLTIFLLLPFIHKNGQPFFLLDIFNRKFIIFGTIWWPHDFYIFAIGFLSIAIFVVLFTAIFGRIWCGWACPQLVMMELVFRKIEYFLEGDANSQRVLKNAPMNAKKFIKKSSKYLIFALISFIINATFLSYVFSQAGVISILSAPLSNIGGLLALIVFTTAFFLNYSWFREQACVYVCPYGRLQSALIDKNSIVVAYDDKRGEPRGKMQKGQISESKGDCIDCGNCVRVCPTGIDIRNGIQLECVGCTNCIDACNKIMTNIKKPKGLIKYASLSSIQEGIKFKITPRIIFYIVILSVLLSVFGFLVLNRTDVEATILRARGSTYVVKENGAIVNIFTMKIMNKTFVERNLTLRTENHKGIFNFAGTDKLVLKADGILEGTFLLEIPQSELSQIKNQITIGIYDGESQIAKVTTTFSGP